MLNLLIALGVLNKGKGDGMIDEPLMRVKSMMDRGKICIASNLLNIEYVIGIHQMWEDIYATV